MYQYSTRGFRRLTVFPGDLIEVLPQELERAQEQFRMNGNQVMSYRSLAERS